MSKHKAQTNLVLSNKSICTSSTRPAGRPRPPGATPQRTALQGTHVDKGRGRQLHRLLGVCERCLRLALLQPHACPIAQQQVHPCAVGRSHRREGLQGGGREWRRLGRREDAAMPPPCAPMVSSILCSGFCVLWGGWAPMAQSRGTPTAVVVQCWVGSFGWKRPLVCEQFEFSNSHELFMPDERPNPGSMDAVTTPGRKLFQAVPVLACVALCPEVGVL